MWCTFYETMKQFTIKGFKGLLQEDKYYMSLTRDSSRMLYYDKCNWFVSETYRTTLANEDEASLFQNLHSTNLKKVLGNRYYKHIINTLGSLGLVMINDKYSAKNFSKSYAITKKGFELGIKQTEIETIKFKHHLSKHLSEELNETIKDKVLHKVLQNIVKLYLFKGNTHFMLKLIYNNKSAKKQSLIEPLKFDRYNSFYNSFEELNEKNDLFEVYKLPVFFKPKRVESGRIYHLGASVPKYIREGFITKKKEIIYEVDMASAQPSILFLEWMRSLRSKGALKPAENAEYELCRGLFLEGGIYAYIRDNSNYYSQFKSEEKYGELKEQILISLNYKHNDKPFVVALKKLFPHFMKWVIDIKEKEGHKRVSNIGQSAEANIFVEVYKRLPDDIFCLIIHDCILTTKENTKLVRRLLVKRLRELYGDIIPSGESLEKVFKIEKVSNEYTIKAKG